jgi:ubiquinone/menaquinone biosynthesis C-methylase UbiE
MEFNSEKNLKIWRCNLYKKIKISRFNGKKRILDIGCGNSDEPIMLAQYCKNVHAFDIVRYPTMIRNTKQIKYTVCSVEKIPFQSNSFDGIFLKDVLHHVEHPKKAIDEIYRVAKKGSLIMILEANRYNPFFYVHMTKLLGHEHFSKTNFIKLLHRKFNNITVTSFESHYMPFITPSLYVFIESIIELIFEKLPFINKFQSYNLAMIIK